MCPTYIFRIDVGVSLDINTEKITEGSSLEVCVNASAISQRDISIILNITEVFSAGKIILDINIILKYNCYHVQDHIITEVSLMLIS